MKRKGLGNFFIAVFLFQIFPLAPLWFELLHRGEVNANELIITLSIYTFATGFISIYKELLAVCLFIGLAEIGLYDASDNIVARCSYKILVVATIIVFFAHVLERYRRHYKNSEPLFIWDNE